MSYKKKINPLWYLYIVVNMLPAMGMAAGIWSLDHIAIFYWLECALVALLAVAMFAKYLIIFFLMAGALGAIVYLCNPYFLTDMQPILIFWALYSLCWLVYTEIGKGAYGLQIKKLKSKEQLIIYFLFMIGAIGLSILITNAVSPTGGFNSSMAFYKVLVSVAMMVPTVSFGLMKVIGMIGEQHFMAFLMGTYHQPQEKNSNVLFLDMVGSSSIAEKMDPTQSMNLIARFIYDCGFIFRVHGGDVLNYTGDGLVVIWPRNKSNNALAAAYKLRSHFSSRAVRSGYWKSFGMVPEFRIGLHAGPIVISQIGEEKLFLGLYGDVVNTAARLEQMNKQLGTSILLSSEVVKGLSQSWKSLLKPMGEKEVRGRDEKVKVFTLYQDS